MNLTESQMKMVKIGVPIFVGLVFIGIIVGIVISKKKAVEKPVADTPVDTVTADMIAADKAAADTIAHDKAASDMAVEKAKTAINAFNTEIIKRDQAVQRQGEQGNTIELFYNAAKAAIVAEKETKDNYNLQKTFYNNNLVLSEATSMYEKAMADTKLAKAAFMTKYKYGITWNPIDIQKVNGYYNELNN